MLDGLDRVGGTGGGEPAGGNPPGPRKLVGTDQRQQNPRRQRSVLPGVFPLKAFASVDPVVVTTLERTILEGNGP